MKADLQMKYAVGRMTGSTVVCFDSMTDGGRSLFEPVDRWKACRDSRDLTDRSERTRVNDNQG